MIDFVLALSFQALKRRFAGIFGLLLAPGNGIGMYICSVWSEGYITELKIVYMYRVIPYPSEHSNFLCTVIRLSA